MKKIGNNMIIKQLFEKLEIPYWGVCSLQNEIGKYANYFCIAFAIPYQSSSINALPNDKLISECNQNINKRIKEIYQHIINEFPEAEFEFFDSVNEKIKLTKYGISQKVLAHLAGLGWIGKSKLLITPKFGLRVKIGTIFTKSTIAPINEPYIESCGNCKTCMDICPVEAICENNFNALKCRLYVKDGNDNDKTFCGLCMKVCPVGYNN